MSDIKIFVTDLDGKIHEIIAPTDMGLSLMEAIRANEMSIKATCGGMALCASCHVEIMSEHLLEEMSLSEEEMLDEAMILGSGENDRLSCQIYLEPSLDGLQVKLGKSTNTIE